MTDRTYRKIEKELGDTKAHALTTQNRLAELFGDERQIVNPSGSNAAYLLEELDYAYAKIGALARVQRMLDHDASDYDVVDSLIRNIDRHGSKKAQEAQLDVLQSVQFALAIDAAYPEGD